MSGIPRAAAVSEGTQFRVPWTSETMRNGEVAERPESDAAGAGRGEEVNPREANLAKDHRVQALPIEKTRQISFV